MKLEILNSHEIWKEESNIWNKEFLKEIRNPNKDTNFPNTRRHKKKNWISASSIYAFLEDHRFKSMHQVIELFIEQLSKKHKKDECIKSNKPITK